MQTARASLPESEASIMPTRTGRTTIDRRLFLGGLGAAVASLAPAGVAAQTLTPQFTSVNRRITVISGLGGNVLVRAGDGGVVMVDSGAAGQANALIGAIDEIAGDSRVMTLFNTHWHLDQVGGNAAVRALDAEIVAHEKTHAHLSTPFFQPTEDRYQPALPADAHPTTRFFDAGVLELDDDAVSYGYLLAAHTDGDIYVRFDNDNVIAAGDAISPMLDPVIDWYGGGWLGGRVDCLKLLLDLSDPETRFVPSYGPVVDRNYVQAEHDLMRRLFDLLFERVRAGESAADIHRSGALDALPRRFDDPGKLLYDLHKSMWGYYNTLSHDIV